MGWQPLFVAFFKGGYSKKQNLFVNSNKLQCSKFSYSLKFQLLKCRFFLWTSSPRKPKIWTSLRPFWTVLSNQTVFSRNVIPSKSLWTSLLLSLRGYSYSWAILFWTKHTQNSKMRAFKIIVKWIILLGEIYFPDLVQYAKLIAGFSHSYQFWVRRTMSQRHGLAAKTVS